MIRLIVYSYHFMIFRWCYLCGFIIKWKL